MYVHSRCGGGGGGCSATTAEGKQNRKQKKSSPPVSIEIVPFFPFFVVSALSSSSSSFSSCYNFALLLQFSWYSSDFSDDIFSKKTSSNSCSRCFFSFVGGGGAGARGFGTGEEDDEEKGGRGFNNFQLLFRDAVSGQMAIVFQVPNWGCQLLPKKWGGKCEVFLSLQTWEGHFWKEIFGAGLTCTSARTA